MTKGGSGLAILPVLYRIVHMPEGHREYLVRGVSYRTIKDLRAAFPGRALTRVRMRPLFG